MSITYEYLIYFDIWARLPSYCDVRLDTVEVMRGEGWRAYIFGDCDTAIWVDIDDETVEFDRKALEAIGRLMTIK